MEIKTFKKLKDNRYKITFDNDEVITLYDDIIVSYNLLSNKVLNDKKLEEIKSKNSEKEAYYFAIKMLNTKMRTKKEIKNQLRKKEIKESIINDVITNLYSEKYLDDERYINAYLNDQINLTIKGPNKIKKELVDLGFDNELIDSYINKIEGYVWEEKISKYITKKLNASSNLSASKLKLKIMIDLINKGFYKELIMEIIDDYEFVTNDDLIMKEYNKIRKKLENKYDGRELKYHIKAKLISKGFSSLEIERVNVSD